MINIWRGGEWLVKTSLTILLLSMSFYGDPCFNFHMTSFFLKTQPTQTFLVIIFPHPWNQYIPVQSISSGLIPRTCALENPSPSRDRDITLGSARNVINVINKMQLYQLESRKIMRFTPTLLPIDWMKNSSDQVSISNFMRKRYVTLKRIFSWHWTFCFSP